MSKINIFGYNGESSLLALYYANMDMTGQHKILPKNFKETQLLIKDDLWENIINNPQYILKKKEDEKSYIVD